MTPGSFVPDDQDVKGLVALTSGTGFVGGALASSWRALLAHQHRPELPRSSPRRLGVELIQGDLSDTSSAPSCLV